jgi:peptide/nickel transport system substrate-binding protein
LTAFAAEAAANRVVVVLDPPAVETNLSWGGIGERLPSLQALVGHDPETGAYAPTELAREWYANDDFTEWTFHLHEDAEIEAE